MTAARLMLAIGALRLTAISVERTPDRLKVLVRLDPGATYKATEFERPSRLAVDVSNCSLAIPQQRRTVVVNQPPLRRVRASQYRADPPVCRIVLDLDSIPSYQVHTSPDGLIIQLLSEKRR